MNKTIRSQELNSANNRIVLALQSLTWRKTIHVWLIHQNKTSENLR